MLAQQHQAWYWLHTTNIMMATTSSRDGGRIRRRCSGRSQEQFYFIWPAVVAPPHGFWEGLHGGVIGDH
jgi:hypothetical protein